MAFLKITMWFLECYCLSSCLCGCKKEKIPYSPLVANMLKIQYGRHPKIANIHIPTSMAHNLILIPNFHYLLCHRLHTYINHVIYERKWPKFKMAAKLKREMPVPRHHNHTSLIMYIKTIANGTVYNHSLEICSL